MKSNVNAMKMSQKLVKVESIGKGVLMGTELVGSDIESTVKSIMMNLNIQGELRVARVREKDDVDALENRYFVYIGASREDDRMVEFKVYNDASWIATVL